MSTATFLDRPAISREGVEPLTDFQALFPAGVGPRDRDFRQCLHVLEGALKDVSSFSFDVEWGEGASVVRGFPGDGSLLEWLVSAEQCQLLPVDEPLAPQSFWSRLRELNSLGHISEAPAFVEGHDYYAASTATSLMKPAGNLVMPFEAGSNTVAVGASAKLVEGEDAVYAFLRHLHSVEREVVPSQTMRALERIRALPENWDGDGATRIAEETVSRATRLIRQAFRASPNDLKPPSVSPAFGGMIVAEWSGPGGRELILDIPPSGEPPGFLLVEPNGEGDEIETDADLTPPWTMRDLIARLAGE